MSLANEIRQKLAQYTSGQLTSAQFRDWFAPVLRDAHTSADHEAAMLAHAAEWEFCDVERGMSSEVVLKENLSRLASVALTNPPEPQNSPIQVQTQYFPLAQSKIEVLTHASGADALRLVVVESNEKSSVVVSELALTA